MCSPSCCSSRRARSASSSRRWRRCVRLPSVAGVRWRAGESQRGAGRAARRSGVEFANSELALTIYSRFRMSPALHWHLHLLGQLLGEFYIAKLREEKLRQPSYLQAVHETGARMTHDIKNLLQSLNVLCSRRPREEREPRLTRAAGAACAASCPLIAQRLAETLEKLQRPQAGAARATSRRRRGGSGSRASTAARASSSSRTAPAAGARGCRARSSTASRTI